MINIAITGANGEVGIGIIKRLIEKATESDKIQIFVGVRSNKKFEYCADQVVLGLAIKEVVKLEDKIVSLVPWICSIETVDQVIKASKELYEKVTHLDYLYLNAGAIFNNGVSVPGLITQFFSNPIECFTTPAFIIHDNSKTTVDGLKRYFAVNVFGHYLLTRMVEELMLKAPQPKLIWSTSEEGKSKFFNVEDIECKVGHEPYGSSKYVVNLACAHLNQRYKHHNMPIKSYLGNPNTVPSSLAAGIVGEFVQEYAGKPFFYFAKYCLGLDMIHYSGYEASIALTHIVENIELGTDKMYTSWSNRNGLARVEVTNLSDIIIEEQVSIVGDYLDGLVNQLAPK